VSWPCSGCLPPCRTDRECVTKKVCDRQITRRDKYCEGQR
jgi:hypothetical protein